jgi:hypothetical protein
MRTGIHRGFADNNGAPSGRRAWVAEGPGLAGEWLTEADYITRGYSPDFDDLPIQVVIRSEPVPISDSDLLEALGGKHA